MAREQNSGVCETCGADFRWYLIHNGFNNSCHACCSECGLTAIISLYNTRLNGLRTGTGEMDRELEPLLACCGCGGRFTAGAAPRCPSCRHELSPKAASIYIEECCTGAKKGWRWQRTWNGIWALYCIVINQRVTQDPFISTG
jgi:hypothetical protein